MILVVASFGAGHWYTQWHMGKNTGTAARKILYYVDPMNPGFRSDKPGNAPCGMPLEPVYEGSAAGSGTESASMPPGTVRISPERQQAIGVKVMQVARTKVSHSFRFLGRVTADETRVYRLNTATDSWVRELSDVSTGSLVEKNQILAKLLAPAFFNAQQTYLITLDTMDRIQRQAGKETRPQQALRGNSQLRSALQGLQSLGISEAQTEELGKTRTPKPYLEVRAPATGIVLARNISLNQWFRAGEELYRVADISRVWVLADTYANEANYIKPGMKVKISYSQMKKTFEGTISKVLPQVDPATRTLKVRIEVNNPDYVLRPDMFVDIELPVSLPETVSVPADAVIETGLKRTVYVDHGDGLFEPRRIETGWRFGKQVEVTQGLMAGEKIVVSGNFLVDSESRMRTAALGIRGEMSKDAVCGMSVDETKAGAAGRTTKYSGKTYYFCSDECKRDFEKNPKKYTGRKAGEQTGSSIHNMHDYRGAGVTEKRLMDSGSAHDNQDTGIKLPDAYPRDMDATGEPAADIEKAVDREGTPAEDPQQVPAK